MEHRHIIFRVQGNAGHGAAGNTVGYCTVSLSEMVEKRKPIRFQCTLLRGGQPAGELQGELLIKWLDGANNVIGSAPLVGRSGGQGKGGQNNPSLTANNPLVKNGRPKNLHHQGSRSMQLSEAEKRAGNN